MSKLTLEERKWCKELQRVLANCPSKRISAYTTGDYGITLYDNSKDGQIEQRMNESKTLDFGPAVAMEDAELVHIVFPFVVHSTAG